MENSAKALIMAGSVLITVAVISLALYTRNSFRRYSDSSELMLSMNQIVSFNRFYESYPQSPETIQVIDMINIYNKAVDDGITKIDGYDGSTIASDKFLNEKKYSIGYDSRGMVNSIMFTN